MRVKTEITIKFEATTREQVMVAYERAIATVQDTPGVHFDSSTMTLDWSDR